jgi:hypothetical protein
MTQEIRHERFLLGDSLPEDVALNIVEDGLPGALRAKPTGIYSSPEVPLELSEPERKELLARIDSVSDDELTTVVGPYLRSLAGSSGSTV